LRHKYKYFIMDSSVQKFSTHHCLGSEYNTENFSKGNCKDLFV